MMTSSTHVPGRTPGKLGVAGGILAFALAVAGCTGPASSGGSAGATIPASPGPAGPLEKTHLTVGTLAVNDDAPLYLAIKDGLFRQAGLTVTPVPVPASADAIGDMRRGTADVIAGADYVSFFQAESKGSVRLRLLADASHCRTSTFQVLALPGSGINGPASLAGKTVAVNLTGSVQTLTLDSLLNANNVSPSSVRYTRVPFPDMAAALKAHKVDAISTIEPYVTGTEEQDGAVPVVSQCTGPTADFPMSGYFATDAWARKYPNTARAFARAIDAAQALANSDQQSVRAILPTYTAVSAQAADVMGISSYPDTVSATALQQVTIMMRTAGMLPGPLSVQSLLLGQDR